MNSLIQIRCISSLSASITRPHRKIYARMYPTLIVKPDGSTFTIRHYEPRQIIKLPVNIWTLSEADRKLRLEQRKPKRKVTYVDDIEDNFDSKRYLNYLKK
ncbi:hypothetical protein FQA39_LY13921 [Lamprigera yunnana]|nr:hypothetical protein FQA39_LY13921 [Lamprigera yunnana]